MTARGKKTLTVLPSPAVLGAGAPTTNGKKPPGPISTIITTGRPLRSVTADGLLALVTANDPPSIFQRGRQLVRIRMDGGTPFIEPLTEAALCGILDRTAKFMRIAPNGLIPVAPPVRVVRDLAALPAWPGIPELAGLTESPTLRPDGSITTTPGYDPETRLIYAPASGLAIPPIPEHPTTDDLARACELIKDLLQDFPFADDASRVHTYALLVTLAARPAIDGPIPLFLIDKPAPGTGASLLMECISRIMTGRPAAMMSPPQHDEEARKLVTALLLSGSPFNVLDNADRVLAASSLARMLTASIWQDRLLGQNKVVSIPQCAVWAATGNNVRITGDLGRRCILIRLDARVPRPWERVHFTHPNLLAWVASLRGELLGAILTLCRAWFASGQPQADASTFGGFEEWVRVIGGILSHLGLSGFLGNREEVYAQVDEAHAGWPAFLEALRTEFGEKAFTSKEIVRRLDDAGSPLRDMLPENLSDGDLTAKKLGEAIKRRVEMRFSPEGLRIERTGDGRAGARWRVVVDGDLAALVNRLAESGDGRHRFALDLARELGYPGLSVAPGRSVAAGEGEWVTFLAQATDEDWDLAIAALQARDGEAT